MLRHPRFPLLTAALLYATCAGAAPLVWHDQPYVTHDRTPLTIPAQAARLVVPEDPARPGGASVELALLRLAATTPSPGCPSSTCTAAPAARRPNTWKRRSSARCSIRCARGAT